MLNRVWIGLDRPNDDAQGDERAALLSKVLERLTGRRDQVFWHSTNKNYCFVVDSGGSYVQGLDSGHWYNLDYLATETP